MVVQHVTPCLRSGAKGHLPLHAVHGGKFPAPQWFIHEATVPRAHASLRSPCHPYAVSARYLPVPRGH